MCLSERQRNPAVIYLLKVNKRNFRARYEVVLVFLLSTLNMWFPSYNKVHLEPSQTFNSWEPLNCIVDVFRESEYVSNNWSL